jgi:hypothetical protein
MRCERSNRKKRKLADFPSITDAGQSVVRCFFRCSTACTSHREGPLLVYRFLQEVPDESLRRLISRLWAQLFATPLSI